MNSAHCISRMSSLNLHLLESAPVPAQQVLSIAAPEASAALPAWGSASSLLTLDHRRSVIPARLQRVASATLPRLADRRQSSAACLTSFQAGSVYTPLANRAAWTEERVDYTLQRWIDEAADDDAKAARLDAAYVIKQAASGAANRLCLAGRNLQSLPECLDALPSLTDIDISGNLLGKLPQRWPPALRRLYADDNDLESIPAELPDSIQELFMRNNRLRIFPANLSRSLVVARLEGNPIEEVPACMYRLPPQAAVFISRENFTFSTQNMVSQCFGSQLPDRSPSGHNLYFSDVVAASEDVAVASILDCLNGWSAEAKDIDGIARTFGETFVSNAATDPAWPDAEQVVHLNDFLAKLKECQEYCKESRRPDFILRVAALLDAATRDASLCATCCVIGEVWLGSCGDGVALAFDDMERAVLIRAVDQGRLSQSELLSVGLKMMKQDKLEFWALQLGADGHSEVAEIALALRINLSERLSLPSLTRAMLYNRFTEQDIGLTPEMIYQVGSMILDSVTDRATFARYLGNWQPWQTYLEKSHPLALKVANLQRQTRLDQLQEEMADLGSSTTLTSAELVAESERLKHAYEQLDDQTLGPVRMLLTMDALSNVANAC